MATEFTPTPGTLIWLKSGSPAMVIELVYPDSVRVRWYSGSRVRIAHLPLSLITITPTPILKVE